jgi:hypothetical protein
MTIGMPVLIGQFLFDWLHGDLRSALAHLLIRGALLFALLLAWTALREHRERKKPTFR